jgi:hemin uptake protein HemP
MRTDKPTESAISQTGANALAAIDADKLLAQREQVVVTFRGEEYRLRRTKNNKLLLTK